MFHRQDKCNCVCRLSASVGPLPQPYPSTQGRKTRQDTVLSRSQLTAGRGGYLGQAAGPPVNTTLPPLPPLPIRLTTPPPSNKGATVLHLLAQG